MESKHKNALIGALLAVVFVMAVGYAAFAQTLTINGSATITSTWNVHFDTTKTSGTDVISPTTGAGGTQAPTGSVGYEDEGQKANITAQLNQPGDKVVFTLTIKNEGNIAATLATPVVTLNGGGSDANPDDLIVKEGNIIFTVTAPTPTTINNPVPPIVTLLGKPENFENTIGKPAIITKKRVPTTVKRLIILETYLTVSLPGRIPGI